MKKTLFFSLLPCWFLVAGPVLAEPGEYWELNSSMEAMGMAMPGQSSKECLPLKDNGDPAGVDKDCTVSDVKRIPNGSSFKFSCKDGSTGSGKQTRTKDTLTSDMQAQTSEGSMKMSVQGKRVGGSCDTGAKAKAALAELDKSCDLSNRTYYSTEKDAAAVATMFDSYHKKGAHCASYKDKACALVKSHLPSDFGVYRTYASQNAEQQAGTAKSCGLGSADSILQSVCKANADNRKEIHALSQHCPAEAKALREKMRAEECSGRQFTSPGDKQKCLAGIDVNASGDSSTSSDSASANPAKNPVDAGKKALKGLKDVFGF